jgi:hypothetical protein
MDVTTSRKKRRRAVFGLSTSVPIKEHVPPDPGAAEFWLRNRRRLLASAYVHAEGDVGYRCSDRVKQQSRNKLGHPDTNALADTNAPGRFGTSGHECPSGHKCT